MSQMTQMRSDTFNNNKTCFGSAIPFLKCSPAIHLCNHHHQRQYPLNTESVAKQEKGQNPVNTEYRKCQEAGEMTKSLEYNFFFQGNWLLFCFQTLLNTESV